MFELLLCNKEKEASLTVGTRWDSKLGYDISLLPVLYVRDLGSRAVCLPEYVRCYLLRCPMYACGIVPITRAYHRMEGVFNNDGNFIAEQTEQTTALKHCFLSMVVLAVYAGSYGLFFYADQAHTEIQMCLTFFLWSLGASPPAASVIHSAIVAVVMRDNSLVVLYIA